MPEQKKYAAIQMVNEKDGISSLDKTEVTQDVIDYVVKLIAITVAPQKIILFGSQASNRAGEGSDIDLFVLQDGSPSNRQVRRTIEHCLRNRRFGLDLIVRTPEEFALNVANGNPFYLDVLLKSGRVVYERH